MTDAMKKRRAIAEEDAKQRSIKFNATTYYVFDKPHARTCKIHTDVVINSSYLYWCLLDEKWRCIARYKNGKRLS